MLLLGGCTQGESTEGNETTLSVSDQTGPGDSITVDQVGAGENYTVRVDYGEGNVTTETFEAGRSQEDLSLGLQPGLGNSTAVDVAVLNEDGEELTTESLQYDVEVEPSGSLTVEDQRGAGNSLTVDSASASVEYYVQAQYGGEQVTTEPFSAGSTQSDLTIELPGITADSVPVDVSVRSANSDEALASATIQYENVATLVLRTNSGMGNSLQIERAGATTNYFVEVQYDGITTRTQTFEGGTTQQNLSVTLDPPVPETQQVTVVVKHADDGTPLAQQTLQYKYRGAVLDVRNQTGSGEQLFVRLAEGTPDFYVRARYPAGTSTSTRFTGGTVQRGVQMPLDPPLEGSTTMRVSLHAANDDERLYDKEIEYTLE